MDVAMVVPLYVARQMKIYAIPESELHALEELVGDKTLWTSIGVGSFVLVIQFVWEWMSMAKGTNPTTQAWGCVIVTSLVTIFAFLKAAINRHKIKTNLTRIENESVVMHPLILSRPHEFQPKILAMNFTPLRNRREDILDKGRSAVESRSFNDPYAIRKSTP